MTPLTGYEPSVSAEQAASLALAEPGPERDRLVCAAIRGEKTAASRLEIVVELEGSAIPAEGERFTLLDSNGGAAARVKVTTVERMAFGQVSDDVAKSEDPFLANADEWRAARRESWSRFVPQIRKLSGDPAWELNDDTMIVVKHFRVV
jgi:uncharacterized protein YhfF